MHSRSWGLCSSEELFAPHVNELISPAKYIFSSQTGEARARHPVWQECLRDRPDDCVEIDGCFDGKIVMRHGPQIRECGLLSGVGLVDAIGRSDVYYIDISGLSHSTWAPLVRAACEQIPIVCVAYVEPESYRRHPNPTFHSEFELSSGFGGTAPLPGFARLTESEGQRKCFVAFLGFEGKRASRIATELDVGPEVYAIVGLPGFRTDYPQTCVASNAAFLRDYRLSNRLMYAAASCPFEAFDALDRVFASNGRQRMLVAPVGTKPHALGAVCYAMRHSSRCEIVYDHPNRRSDSSRGVSSMHFYWIKPSGMIAGA